MSTLSIVTTRLWKLPAVVVTAAATLGAVSLQAQQVQVSPANRTIAITTTENAERRADVATLHIGFRVFASDSAGVYAEAARISTAVAAALDKLGVPKDAIASEGQSTQPIQPMGNDQLTPVERAQRKFEATQSWSVKTTPNAVGKVLAESVAAGANESGQIDWSLADEASLVSEAAAKALEHAGAIASQMAQGLNASVGKLLYASNEVESVRPRIMLRAEGKASISGMGGSFMAPRLNLSAPMVSRSATVSAIFAVE